MTDLITFRIDKVISLNEFLRWHWRKRKEFKDELNAEVYTHIRLNFKSAIPMWEKISVAFTIHGPRVLDADNRVAIVKAVMDSIKISGLIEDDGPDHAEYGLPAYIREEESYTDVLIRRVK